MISDEVYEFAREIGAKDLKAVYNYSELHGLFKRRNYFLLDDNKFLIIKISRNKIRPFYGLGKRFFDLFNNLTEGGANYFFVALVSNQSGWVLSKAEILSQISNGSISYSETQKQYKINNYNLLEEYEKKVKKEPHIFCHKLPRRKRRGIKMSVLSFLSQPRKRDLCFAPTSCGELNLTDFASSFK